MAGCVAYQILTGRNPFKGEYIVFQFLEILMNCFYFNDKDNFEEIKRFFKLQILLNCKFSKILKKS